jgi:two-component system cell cycle sensor histidine kinase/response regulator CckA
VSLLANNSAPSAREAATPKRRLRVLMVEDNPDDADLLLRELHRGQFDVVWTRVQTASAMREALLGGTWDLIISDYSMPEFDAPRALAVLKETNLDLPFIVLSGTITEESAVESLRAGAHDFISKGKLARLLPALDRELREGQVRKARHEAEAALRESEQRYRRIIETTNEGVWLLDEASCTTFVNARMAALLGLDASQVLGKSIFDFIHEESQADVESALERRVAGTASHAEIRLLRKSAPDVWALFDATPIVEDDDRHGGTLVMAIDITERKRLEDQLRQSQKLEAIGSLAGGVAHDFNNLLSVIASYAELLTQSITDQTALEDLREIQGATERAAALTKQLLAFSRKQVLMPTVLDLNKLVTEMESMLTRVISKEIELTSRLGSNIGRVKVDRGQVDQVLLNLVVNARDAMPKGGKVTIETLDVVLGKRVDGVDVTPGRYAALRVTDTGTGMDGETQTRLFEPFFTTKEPGKGTGLGLATVHGIVKQSGGHIAVTSALGRGTTFTIYLPTVADESRPANGVARS